MTYIIVTGKCGHIYECTLTHVTKWLPPRYLPFSHLLNRLAALSEGDILCSKQLLSVHGVMHTEEVLAAMEQAHLKTTEEITELQTNLSEVCSSLKALIL